MVTPRYRLHGFTLLELMVVTAIIAILAAVAYPSYRAQVRKSNRAAAQSLLMDAGLRQQQRFLDVRAYAETLDELGVAIPEEVSSNYALAIDLDAGTPPGFTVSAAPTGSQVADICATLSIDETGTKTPADCW